MATGTLFAFSNAKACRSVRHGIWSCIDVNLRLELEEEEHHHADMPPRIRAPV
jgi:hypothetical protein